MSDPKRLGRNQSGVARHGGERVARVVIPPPAPPFALDYLPPESSAMPPAGARVKVRLAGRPRVGLAIGQARQTHSGRLNRIEAVLDNGRPAIPAGLLELLLWIARYYHYPLAHVFLHALPKPARQGRPMDEMMRHSWEARCHDTQSLSRAPAQKKLFERLLRGAVDEKDLPALSSNWRALVKALAEKGLVRRVALAASPVQPLPSPHTLSAGQSGIVKAVLADSDRFVCHLIEGVTGSGKTEIYLRLAEAMVASGRQTLVLTPEIGLSSQLAKDFRARFGPACMVFHSALSDERRFQVWSAARRGSADIVIGTRSAIFLPFTRLGVIVVDEEHDLSYKQQEKLRYHGRDVAVKRMQLLKRPVVLGSATPSLESLHQAMLRRYQRHQLRQRAASASGLRHEIIDLRHKRLRCGLSPRLLEVVHKTVVEDSGQALLFINRRGYATRLICNQCGEISMCPDCDCPMVYHLSDGVARCHHCGRVFTKALRCMHCSASVKPLGLGTERVESLLKELFPSARVARIDADSTRSKGALERQLDQAREGQAMLLVGTQMLSKGYHLPHLHLIGIINLDHRLFSPDFRSLERLGQLVDQVSGRAGRGRRQGHVLLQTYHPDSPHLSDLLRHGYSHFAEKILHERKANKLPPYSFLALFNARARQSHGALRFLERIQRCLSPHAEAGNVALFGPAPAMMEKRAGFFRAQLLLRATQRSALHRCLNSGMPCIHSLASQAGLSWSLDVDPMEIENLQEVN